MKPIKWMMYFIVFAFLPFLQTAKADNVDDTIIALAEQFHAASTHGDSAFMESFVSNSDAPILLGSAPEEVVMGHDNIASWWAGLFDFLSQLDPFYVNGGLPVQNVQHLQVGHTGNSAWVMDTAEWNFKNGVVPFRVSLIFIKEKGQWKNVQQHFSVGINNEDLPL